MINEKELNNQNLNENPEEVDSNEEQNTNEEFTKDNSEYKSVEVIYNESHEPILVDKNDCENDNNNLTNEDATLETEEKIQLEKLSDDNQEPEPDQNISNQESLELEQKVLDQEVSDQGTEELENVIINQNRDEDNNLNKKQESDAIKEEVSESNSEAEVIEENEPIKMAKLPERHFDVAEIIKSKHLFSVKEILEIIKKELTLDNFDILLKAIKNSKYNKTFEVLGYFLYFVYENKLSEEQIDDIILGLDNEEIVCTYAFAILNARKYKNKSLVKTLFTRINEIPCTDSFLLKFIKSLKSKKRKIEYKLYERKVKKIKKIVKKYKKTVAKKEEFNTVDESLTRYIFSIYGEYRYTKKCQKLYSKIESKLTNEMKINCLLSLALGYQRVEKFKKAKKIYNQVLLLDNENYEASIGLVITNNKCVNLEQLLSKKKVEKIKEYDELINKLLNSKEDALAYKVYSFDQVKQAEKKLNLEEKLKYIRKHISLVSYIIGTCLLNLTFFVNNPTVKILGYVCMGIFVLATFISTKIKSRIVTAIIKLVLAGAIIAESIILSNIIGG